ncbi:MAG: PilZ domain-containing protein [Sphingorhabdus sp.]
MTARTEYQLHYTSRSHARGSVSIAADIREKGGGRNKISILDLSQTGFRMQCGMDIPDDRVIFLTIPGFSQLESRIAWRKDWIYGCKFIQPLHPAIYDHIVRTHPALGASQGL